jgi:SWI/SNF-related matrix-associated actin-dependent regulator 1 of chromatin subfamily A
MNKSKLKLRDYQKEAALFLVRKKKAYLSLDCGLGKTATAIMASQLFDPILVVCPSIATMVWEKELQMWLKKDLKIQVIKKGKDELDPTANIFIMSFAMCVKKERELRKLKITTTIVDEAHYLKSMDAKRTKAVCRLLMKSERAYALTGTPMPNRPVELYPVMKALGATDMDYKTFTKRYCAAWQPPWMKKELKNGTVIRGWDVTGKSNLRELGQLLGESMFRRTKEQVAPELPPKTFQVLSLGLSVDKREREFNLEAIEYEGSPVAFTGLSEILHMQGLAKVPKTVEYVKEQIEYGNAKKIIVFAHHKEVIEQYKEKLRKLNPVVITGATSKVRRQEAVNSFQCNPDTKVIILQIQAGSTAITLTEADLVLFAESCWRPVDIHQASDRAHRIGQEKPVLVQFMTVAGSIDEYVLKKVLQKLKVINKVVDNK